MRRSQKLADPSLWHQPGTEIGLGCVNCPELRFCGGLSIRAPVFDCMALCCGHPITCERYACPNQSRYSNLVNEVDSLALRPYQHPVLPMRPLPEYVPCILDSSGLAGPLRLPAVAISLYSVIDLHTGLAKFASREQLLQQFGIDSRARLVLAATGKDNAVERFWHALRPKSTAESLQRLRPALIATPNFSMHCDTVRHDNLVSMKRISYCFEAFAGAGLPVALHVNGRTPYDFSRWTEYLVASPHIGVVSYELGTIGRSSTRRAWHVDQLVHMAENVGRPLTLALRGGWPHLLELSAAFDRVILMDTTAHMKAKKRQRGRRIGECLEWLPAPTAPNEPLDALVLHNIRVSRAVRRASQRNVGPSNTRTAPSKEPWVIERTQQLRGTLG